MKMLAGYCAFWAALGLLAILVIAGGCTTETNIVGPDCFAKADSAGGPGGTVVSEGEGSGAAGGSSSASSGCSGSSVSVK